LRNSAELRDLQAEKAIALAILTGTGFEKARDERRATWIGEGAQPPANCS